MASFIDEFMKGYGSEVSQQMSKNFNVDQGTVQKLIPQLAPLILAGLKKQKDTQGGNDRVNHILNKYGDSSVLGNITDLISSKSKETKSDPNLGGLLGDQGGFQAAQALGSKMGIDSATIMKMIPVLSPLILGALSKKRDSDAKGLPGIGALLDATGNSKILDDVAGFLLKGTSTGSKSQGGLLGALLKGMGRRK